MGDPRTRDLGGRTVARRLAQAGYGILFTVLLPLLLTAWAHALEGRTPFPPAHDRFVGVLLVVAGLAATVGGMIALWRFGGGLPMNAFPPPRYVSRSIYGFLPHPIYVGFCAAVAGVAMLTGSGAGLWFVLPACVVSCFALVWGYERHDLRRRFGSGLPAPRISLPLGGDRPDVWQVASTYALVLFPWLVLYEATMAAAIFRPAGSTELGFESRWPVWQSAEAFYGLDTLFVLAAPWFAANTRSLRHFCNSALTATLLGCLIYFAFPTPSVSREFVPTNILGHLLAWERRMDQPSNGFPAFHVTWAMLAARLFASRGRIWAGAAWTLAGAIAASCLLTGSHSVLDVLGGAALFVLADQAPAVWEGLRRASERAANSWAQTRLGPVRIINHGVFAGLAAGAGTLVVAGLLGGRAYAAIAVCGGGILLGAGAWGQWLEGSGKLLRPFGFYGGAIGAACGVLVCGRLGAAPWNVAAAVGVAAPWIQAIGRLRCLVQGCCHGHRAPAWVGIRYSHPKSRVCRIADLQGVPIHPTPLYSMLCNAVIGLVLMRFWALHVEASIVLGCYLFLGGAARFAEEAYRGEPQTPRVGGLPVYQWCAIGTVVLGAALASVKTEPVPEAAGLSFGTAALAFVMGVTFAFAMGCDFPNSNRRFARLA